MDPKIIFLSVVTAITSFFQPPSFISPFADSVDLDSVVKSKVESKISDNQILDYTKSKTLTSLKNIPRYLVYNSDNNHVYAAKNEKESFSPASFSKLMTAQVAIDLKLDNHLLQVSSKATQKEPTVLGLKVTEQLPLSELLRAAIATSANDAAYVLAESSISPYGNNLEKFIELMNYKAQKMNMNNTQFANPEGYDDEKQYSTLEDIVTLIQNVQNNYPEIIAAGKSDRQDIKPDKTHGGYYLTNWNGLLGIYPGVDGLKIAYTKKAGYGTIVTARRNGIKVVAIVSGATSIPERDLAAAALLDSAFITEKIPPANVTKAKLQVRYNQWQELINKIRQELKELEQS
jgi:D-alanyl-D-alanine carboxypeptidase